MINLVCSDASLVIDIQIGDVLVPIKEEPHHVKEQEQEVARVENRILEEENLWIWFYCAGHPVLI